MTESIVADAAKPVVSSKPVPAAAAPKAAEKPESAAKSDPAVRPAESAPVVRSAEPPAPLAPTLPGQKGGKRQLAIFASAAFSLIAGFAGVRLMTPAAEDAKTAAAQPASPDTSSTQGAPPPSLLPAPQEPAPTTPAPIGASTPGGLPPSSSSQTSPGGSVIPAASSGPGASTGVVTPVATPLATPGGPAAPIKPESSVKRARFKFTEQTFSEMAITYRFPATLVARLSSLKNREMSQDELEAELNKLLLANEKTYIQSIEACSRVADAEPGGAGSPTPKPSAVAAVPSLPGVPAAPADLTQFAPIAPLAPASEVKTERYIITDAVLASLQKYSMPAEVVVKLGALKNKPLTGEELDKELARVLSAQEQQWKSAILFYAKQPEKPAMASPAAPSAPTALSVPSAPTAPPMLSPEETTERYLISDAVLTTLQKYGMPPEVAAKLSSLKNKSLTKEELDKELARALSAVEELKYRADILDYSKQSGKPATSAPASPPGVAGLPNASPLPSVPAVVSPTSLSAPTPLPAIVLPTPNATVPPVLSSPSTDGFRSAGAQGQEKPKLSVASPPTIPGTPSAPMPGPFSNKVDHNLIRAAGAEPPTTTPPTPSVPAAPGMTPSVPAAPGMTPSGPSAPTPTPGVGIPSVPAAPSQGPGSISPALPAAPTPGASGTAPGLPSVPSSPPGTVTPTVPSAPAAPSSPMGLSKERQIPSGEPKNPLATPNAEPKLPAPKVAVEATSPLIPSLDPTGPAIPTAGAPGASDRLPTPKVTPEAPVAPATTTPKPVLIPSPGDAAATPPKPIGAGVKSSALEKPPTTSYDVDLYEAKPNDTWESVSQDYYNTKGYAAALKAANQNRPQPTGTIEVPPIYILKQKFQGRTVAQASGTTAAVPPPPSPPPGPSWGPSTVTTPAIPSGGAKVYRIPAGGMSMRDVARITLGSEQRWDVIYNLNPQLNPSMVPGGTDVRLPADARLP